MDKILNKLKQNGLTSLRGEFETEGMEQFDLDILDRLCFLTNLNKTIKIGGVDAHRDLRVSLLNGANLLIAPMVESSFALKKYLNNINSLKDLKNLLEQSFSYKPVNFAINIESKTAVDNLNEILDLAKKRIGTIVVGRVDLADSFAYDRQNIGEINNIVEKILIEAKNRGFKTSLGGGITYKTIDFLKYLKKNKYLDFFETRKLVFDLDKVQNYELVVQYAIEFEEKYLILKENYKKFMANKIKTRLNVLRDKLN